jgi:hypothetical protein
VAVQVPDVAGLAEVVDGRAGDRDDTRSGARRWSNHSAVMIDADDAWWPPTFTPEGVFRTLFA